MRPILMGAMVGNVDIVKMLINAGCDCRVANKVRCLFLIFSFIIITNIYVSFFY